MTDIRMPPGHHMEGIDAAHRIRAEHPDVGVVVLSQHADESYAFALLKNGTDGLAYLLKDRIGDLDELLRALREVVAGRSAIDARVVDALVARRARREAPASTSSRRASSTSCARWRRERATAGSPSALVLSESAVEKHVSSILGKLGRPDQEGMHRRVAAVLAFLRDSRCRR